MTKRSTLLLVALVSIAAVAAAIAAGWTWDEDIMGILRVQFGW